MTVSVVVMIIIGIVFIFVSYFISESITKKEENFNADLLTINNDYEFSERERGIIQRKIEDVIAQQARDILYETNESLSNMANEKTLALGDYAVAVCDEIERNHKEVMFLYSMLDDKQKEIMQMVQTVDKASKDLKHFITEAEEHSKHLVMEAEEHSKPSVAEAGVQSKHSIMDVEVKKKTVEKVEDPDEEVPAKKQSAIDQLTALKHRKEEAEAEHRRNSVTQEKASPEENKQAPETKTEHVGAVTKKEAVSSVSMDDEIGVQAKKNVGSGSLERKRETDGLSTKGEEFDDVFEEMERTDLDLDDALDDEFKKSANSNDIILEMYRNGDSVITIAKELGLGVGEVKLVIDLYQGE
jgi:hypothetical protein